VRGRSGQYGVHRGGNLLIQRVIGAFVQLPLGVEVLPALSIPATERVSIPGPTLQGDDLEMKPIAPILLLSVACLMTPSFAMADSFTTGTITVNGTDNIYAAGSQNELVTNCVAVNYCGAGGQGTVPNYISVAGQTYITLTSSGTISINGGANSNDPDGLSGGSPAYVPTSFNSGFESISGIMAPGAGYLVGVFVGPNGPSGTAPASVTYTSATTDLTSYDPLLDQVFFIGDGLTGDGTGAVQDFYVPTGATELYLGISDACEFEGGPSCYGDNSGATSVAYSEVTSSPVTPPAATPEPSSLLLLATGAMSAAGMVRRRFKF